MTSSFKVERALFETAVGIREAAEQKAFLDKACGGDGAQRVRIQQWVDAQEAAGDFFENATQARSAAAAEAMESGAAGSLPNGESVLPPAALEAAEGTRVGRYRLLERIGEGGCGVVYLAEQSEPVRRRVALKVIRLGMDTASVIGRFETERQALALMDHPNIAHVLDAGTTESGRPFFVMDLAHGVKITEYCDSNQLGTRQRLDLFIHVCHAIQHAHQKGIIHRDIKPSNILVSVVDGVAVPKVIDFGIARATECQLGNDTTVTACGQLLGTPAYMSPEQAEGGHDIDTRSDVYSLGALLYELLTGRPPFDTKELAQTGMLEMLRTLREKEPRPPSALLGGLPPNELASVARRHGSEPGRLVAAIRGDLDWIVMKALVKDRLFRYETVNGLAMDIERFLSEEPVLARPPSRAYLFSKLVRRNRVLFAAVATVAVALMLGLGTSSWLFVRERLARHDAETAHRNESRLLQQSKSRETVSQAAILLAQGEVEAADTLLASTPLASLDASLEAANVFSSLGEWNAVNGRWKQASDCFALFVKLDPWDRFLKSKPSGLVALAVAASFMEAGSTASYDRWREMLLSHADAVTDPEAADAVVKATLLLPANRALLEQVQPLVAIETGSQPAESVGAGVEAYQAAFRALSLSMATYRQGDFVGALRWSRQCLGYPDSNEARSAAAHALGALAACHLRQPELARAELAESRKLFELPLVPAYQPAGPGRGLWFDWAIARVLLREATGLIENTPPAPIGPK